MADEECHEVVNIGTDVQPPDGLLLCTLPIGHDGAHYDGVDNVTWKVGKPDER